MSCDRLPKSNADTVIATVWHMQSALLAGQSMSTTLLLLLCHEGLGNRVSNRQHHQSKLLRPVAKSLCMCDPRVMYLRMSGSLWISMWYLSEQPHAGSPTRSYVVCSVVTACHGLRRPQCCMTTCRTCSGTSSFLPSSSKSCLLFANC